MNEFNGVEIVEQNLLDFSEPYKDWEPSAVEDTYVDAFHLNSTGSFGTRIYFLTKLKYVAF